MSNRLKAKKQYFASQDSGLSRIFNLILSISEEILDNINVVA